MKRIQPNSTREQFEHVVALLMLGSTHTEDELDRRLAQMRVGFPTLDDDDVEYSKRKLMERLLIDMDFGTALTATTFKPWLPVKYSTIHWDHWLLYKRWLVLDDWSPTVLDQMDGLTNDILDLVGDPTVGTPWARRGLVIGDVQSGKTATYLALLNKAVDAGYRLIIVLAGGTEALRQQTQERIEEGLIGRDSKAFRNDSASSVRQDRYVGVGKLDAGLADATGMTTRPSDFRRNSKEATNIQISPNASSPYIFVVKKNKTVLNTLAEWLGDQPKSQGKLQIPVLLLDDESDYASVNTKEEDDPTAINAAIRGLLDRFSRSSYLAVTATPFANIFIDHDIENDLFPRDYIYALEAPSNYVGSNATFGSLDDAKSERVVSLQDAASWLPVKHKASAEISALPQSLLDAMRAFFVANAIRDLRGDEKPRSMLINVSRYKRVQRQVFEMVEAESRILRNALDLHSVPYSRGVPNVTIEGLHRAFSNHFGDVGLSWGDVFDALRNAVALIEVQLFNSDRDVKLTENQEVWGPPRRMIAVGGDVLSRGLTLKGLTVSYFHRNVGAYDTLMQMGRWFGYRDGYEDLCRIWIDDGIASQYRYVQDAIDELKSDLADMRKLGLTPTDFGLAVKKHPGSLLVTARNKMKSATESHKQISLAGRNIESTRLSIEQAVVEENRRAFHQLASSLPESARTKHPRGANYWQGVPKSVVAEFLTSFRTAASEPLFFPGALARFVHKARAPKFQSWDVVIVNGARKGVPEIIPSQPEIRYFPPERTVVAHEQEYRISGRSSRLAGSDDVAILLPAEKREAVEARFTAGLPPAEQERGVRKSPPETRYYREFERPVLLIYPLRPARPLDRSAEALDDETREAFERLGGVPLVATKIVIPNYPGRDDGSADAEYIINTVAQQSWFPEFRDDEDGEDFELG